MVRFVLLLCLIMSYTSAQKVTNLSTDQSSLLTLKSHITSDPQNILTNNWTTKTSVCTWIGVTCSSRHLRVTTLDISNMGLEGIIPPEIGKLSFLVYLNMSKNSFQGNLPKELALLHRLRAFDMSFNRFTGELSFIFNFSPLQTISLTNNGFSGSLPVDICSHNLGSLSALSLSNNKFNGEIPLNLHRCSWLRVIALSYNNFVGNVPRGLGNLTMLETLLLAGNGLSGTIPQEITQLYNLKHLRMERNNFVGKIPQAIFNISSLQNVSFGRNYNLLGTIPPEIGNLTMLKGLYLNDNQLTGTIPLEIGYISGLEVLNLANNSFTGSIPSAIFNMSQIQSISVAQNLLSGNLPTSFNLPNLKNIYLNMNNFNGTIPTSITNCTKLVILELSFNYFTGPILNLFGNLRLLEILNLSINNFYSKPSSTELSFLTSLTQCRYLMELGLVNNPLDGILPRSIGNLSESLEFIAASGCKIKGSIPKEIGNLSNLQDLYLADNNLDGLIPTTFRGLRKLQILNLDNNKFKESFPDAICSLSSLGILDLGRNQISGPIPECLGNVSSLREIYLSANQLNSSIPESFWNLDLIHLHLSFNFLSGSLSLNISNFKGPVAMSFGWNLFSGTIPSTIGSFLTLINITLNNNQFHGSIPEAMSNMLSLQRLDLSENNLSGTIPKSLEKLKDLIYFNVSFNNLTGEIPSEGPFGNFTHQSFMSNKDLCGPPRFNVQPCPINSVHKSRKKEKLLTIIFASVGVVVVIVTVFVLMLMRYRKKHLSPYLLDLLSPLRQRRISYYELEKATDGYNESNLLGIGGFGAVYKGVLRDGTVLAVKVFDLQVERAMKSFDAECEVLRNLRHRNLTKVISSCSNNTFKALVLEYMPKGNLERWLYSHNYFLNIMQRLDIMIDVASALEYLHHGYSTPVIHCDLKPSNVLLDEDMVAHVSDFGMARMLVGEDSIAHTRTLATLGYMAPEYGMEGTISPRCDVYSYGIMLMEVFVRTKPSDERFVGDLTMKRWVQDSLPNVQEIVDSNLLNPNEQHHIGKLSCLTSIMELAIGCTVESPRERTDMKDVLSTLKKVKLGLLSCINGQISRQH